MVCETAASPPPACSLAGENLGLAPAVPPPIATDSESSSSSSVSAKTYTEDSESDDSTALKAPMRWIRFFCCGAALLGVLEREDRVLEAIEYTEDGAGLTGLNLVMREMRVRETPFLLACLRLCGFCF